MHDKTILHITGMFSTKYGGMENFFLAASEVAAKFGFQTIIQYESCPISQKFIADCKSKNIILANAAINSSRYGCYNIVKLIHKYKPFIVHAHFLYGLNFVATPIIARLMGANRVFKSVHNPVPLDTSSFRAAIRCRSLDQYDVLLAVSPRVLDTIHACGAGMKNNSFIHYLGVADNLKKDWDSDRFIYRAKYNIPFDAAVCGCIAFDEKFKGVDIFINCLALAPMIKQNIYAFIIGVDPSRSTLPVLADRLGVGQRVRWAGIVDEAWRLLSAVDMYVQPSRSEGGPLTVMEAMSLKLPVVVTTGAGVSDVLIDHVDALIVDTENSEALALAVAEVVRNKSLSEQIGLSGRQVYERLFSLEASARELVETYYVH